MTKSIGRKKTGGNSGETGEFRWETGVNRQKKALESRKQEAKVGTEENLGE